MAQKQRVYQSVWSADVGVDEVDQEHPWQGVTTLAVSCLGDGRCCAHMAPIRGPTYRDLWDAFERIHLRGKDPDHKFIEAFERDVHNPAMLWCIRGS